MRKILLIFMLTLFSHSAYSFDYTSIIETGTDLHDVCSEANKLLDSDAPTGNLDGPKVAACSHYLTGFIAGLVFSDNTQEYCPPQSMNLEDVVGLVTTYLDYATEQGEEALLQEVPVAGLVHFLLQAKWPCD